MPCTRYRIGLVLTVLSTVGCDSGGSPRALDAGAALDGANPMAGDAGADASPIVKFNSPLTLTVDAGGPYMTAAGKAVALSASYSIAGQADEAADLKAIADALQAYAAVNGAYPPAALSNSSGVALLSWRVLLLPYLGMQDLYARFDLGKAWNDPANAALANQMPEVYRNGAGDGSTNTHYAGVAGPRQLFSRSAPFLSGGLAPKYVVDGRDSTIAVGPVGSQVGLPWTAPGDVSIAAHLQLGKADGFAGSGDVATPLAFLDGTVHTFANDLDPKVLKRLSTPAGDTSPAGCICDRPASLDIGLNTSWDLDGDGMFETSGATALYSSNAGGNHDVKFRVVDRFGGEHSASAKVVVQ